MKFEFARIAPQDPSHAFAMRMVVKTDQDVVTTVYERDYNSHTSHAYAAADLLSIYAERGDEFYVTRYEDEEQDEPDPFRDDVEADADTLRSAGYGTDEDYGYFGGDDY